MPFKVEIDAKLDNTARIVMPISMGQKYHAGDRLKALIGFAKQYNTTLIIADGLQRHNTKSDKEALKMGAKFLKKNVEILKDAVEIDSLEKWHQYKDTQTLKVIRWDTWRLIKKTELAATKKALDERLADSKSEEGATLLQSMKDAAKTSFSAVDEESSINYQKEENEVLLTFSDFDCLCYPDLNASQIEIYKQFAALYHLPRFVSPKFISTDLDIKAVTVTGFFSGNAKPPITNKRHANSLPIALRLIIETVEKLMQSNEISEEHKKAFILKLKSSVAPSVETLDSSNCTPS
jgi:hypothetical protein